MERPDPPSDGQWRAASLAKAAEGRRLLREHRAHGLAVAEVLVDGRVHAGLLVLVASPVDAVHPASPAEWVPLELDGTQVMVPVLVRTADQPGPE